MFAFILFLLFYFDNDELNYEIDNTINIKIDYLDVDINKTSHNAVIYEDGVETYYVGGDGHEIYLQNNPNATNPTYDELIIFLKNDKTDLIQYTDNFVCADFAERVHNNAEESGIRAAWVSLDFDNDNEGHALNAFHTVDNGLVFTDSTGSVESTPCGYDRKIGIEIGKHIWTYKLYDCAEDYYYLLPSSKVKEVKIFW